jgi:hypothetical protein
MFAPQYRLSVTYGVSPDMSRKVTSTVPTLTWVCTDLRCAFSTKSDATKTPNEAEIKVWNVSPNNLQKLSKLGKVRLEAGYLDDVFGTIFIGDILQCVTTSEADGVVTTIRCKDGGRAHMLGRVALSYAKNTAWQQVALGVLDRTLTATGLGEGNARRIIAQTQGKAYVRGYSDSGSALRVFSTVMAVAGLEVSVQGGALQLQPSNQPVPGPVLEISSSSGLIGSPSLAGNAVDTGGLTASDVMATQQTKAKKNTQKVECFLLPNVTPGQTVHVTSKQCNSYYTVTQVKHTGDSMGSAPWKTVFELETT